MISIAWKRGLQSNWHQGTSKDDSRIFHSPNMQTVLSYYHQFKRIIIQLVFFLSNLSRRQFLHGWAETWVSPKSFWLLTCQNDDFSLTSLSIYWWLRTRFKISEPVLVLIQWFTISKSAILCVSYWQCWY